MKSRRVDLNLLHVFDAVMRERSLTRAAKALGLTPSAVSHALARLRLALHDELFLRDGADMKPTPRALELAALVRGSLAALETALAQTPFVPALSGRTFRLAAGDYGGLLVLPRLAARLATMAPQIDLQVLPPNRLDIGHQLERGAVDIVFGWFDGLPPETRRRTLLTESGVFVVRAGHPLTSASLTPDRLFAFPHLVVDLTGAPEAWKDGFLDDGGLVRRVWMECSVLEARGRRDLSARVAMTVPSFVLAAPIIRRSDMVATLPERLARRAVAEGGIVMLERIAEPLTVTLEAVWHARGDKDEGLQWLLNTLAEICAEIAAEPTAADADEGFSSAR
jgi:DNA-binding transcriptional LysR family regulator